MKKTLFTVAGLVFLGVGFAVPVGCACLPHDEILHRGVEDALNEELVAERSLPSYEMIKEKLEVRDNPLIDESLFKPYINKVSEPGIFYAPEPDGSGNPYTLKHFRKISFYTLELPLIKEVD